MFTNILTESKTAPNSGKFILCKMSAYLEPFLASLHMDSRLLRTLFDVFSTIIMFRERHMGLLLSELGGYICGHDHAPAGTKRVSNLLRSSKWSSEDIDKYFLGRSKDRIEEMGRAGDRPLLLWDESVVEKPESRFVEGLCPVHSSKGQRLTRIKNGYFSPPKGRINVPGYHWTSVMLSCLGGTPSVCRMAWWTTKGKFKEWGTNIIYRMLRWLDENLGRSALNVFDRGYASETMLEWLFQFNQDFLIRWKQNILLINELGDKKKTHLLAKTYRAENRRWVMDKERKQYKLVGVSWAPVRHPAFPDIQLWIVIVRDKTFKGPPIYLLTNTPVESSRQAWEMCFSYFHRWAVEQAFRFAKSEMGLESPRLWFWENRLKLMGIVSLAFDFLLQMLRLWPNWIPLFLNRWCKRTGEKCKQSKVPIYRLRAAMSQCLTACWCISVYT